MILRLALPELRLFDYALKRVTSSSVEPPPPAVAAAAAGTARVSAKSMQKIMIAFFIFHSP